MLVACTCEKIFALVSGGYPAERNHSLQAFVCKHLERANADPFCFIRHVVDDILRVHFKIPRISGVAASSKPSRPQACSTSVHTARPPASRRRSVSLCQDMQSEVSWCFTLCRQSHGRFLVPFAPVNVFETFDYVRRLQIYIFCISC